LYTQRCPLASKNFLKLCKIKYYNNCLFHNIQKHFIAQTGDPTNTGQGGTSIWGILEGEHKKFFEDEITPAFRFNKKGLLAMANKGPNMNASQFFITIAEEKLPQLDEKHTIFGEISEGLEFLDKLNEVYTDSEGKALQVVRIKHCMVVYDPFDDPPGLTDKIPNMSPIPSREQWADLLDEDEIEKLGKPDEREAEVIEEEQQAKSEKSRGEVLEIIGDIPAADVKPPDNVLFVCKLNQVTTSEDLETIFSRFGEIKSCEVIRDWKTGDSLNYAFIEFVNFEDCEQAYLKMDNVLIDDRRIHVDFSQSVSKLVKGKDGRTVRMLNEFAHTPQAQKTGKIEGTKNLTIKQHGRETGHYDMVFEDEAEEKHIEKKRKGSGSHHERKSKKSSPEREKDRSHRRSPERRRSRSHERERHRDYSRK